ncbi:LAQU0S17e00298g1_1 [Lachancea quebecensis]|uniref:Non-structural maintenance of chromosomes element 1 homolog n=1 Tax=Lachancea quebecensis TaxID=1654605 RepID=A0A0P1KWT5_9SACH|nr:LAQU0S17e00298g1_1 [Lachancea quebecensis]
MEVDAGREESEGRSVQLSDEDKGKFLLQYVLSRRGVCSERALAKALKALECDGEQLEDGEAEAQVVEMVGRLNVRLSALDYKLVRQRDQLGAWTYAYVDVLPSEDTKLATPLTIEELKYVQWCVREIVEAGQEVVEAQGTKSVVERSVDEALAQSRSGQDGLNAEYDSKSLRFRVSYTAGARQLFQSDALGPLETERLLTRLCQLRWLYRTSEGQFGLATRALAELQEYLRTQYTVPICTVCDEVALRGVKCQCSEGAWHAPCFQHYVAHVSTACASCERPVLEAIYMA